MKPSAKLQTPPTRPPARVGGETDVERPRHFHDRGPPSEGGGRPAEEQTPCGAYHPKRDPEPCRVEFHVVSPLVKTSAAFYPRY